MFVHNFKYTLKTLFRNKSLIFWTFAFPILLGLFFNMAFSDIENSEKLQIIDIAVVNNEEFNENIVLKEAFKELSDENNKDRLFNISYVNSEEANNLLNDKKISGYLLINDKPNVVIKENGINETVLKQVTEELIQTSDIASRLSKIEIEKKLKNNELVDYESIYNKVYSSINASTTKLVDKSSTNLSYTLIEFYTLIAMACLYGGILGMTSINQCLPNMSNNGKRVSVSPTSKGSMILSSILASYVVQLIGISLLFIFTIFVLNINYGNNVLLVILLSLVGSLAGLSIGIFTGTVFKTNENAKVGIIIAITMLFCFLSGMMGITMKYIIDKNIPILNIVNPASMITDGFYSLYYYDTYNRYAIDIISLSIFSFVMFLISFISLRRQKYDSI